MNQPTTATLISVGKVLVSALFPFFKDSKAVQIIKKDIEGVTGEVLTRMYDTAKGLFIVDTARKSTWEQLQAEPDDFGKQAEVHHIIKSEMDKNGDFAKQMQDLVASLDNVYSSDAKNIVKEVEGEDNNIQQGQHTKDGQKVENTVEKVKGNRNTIIQG